MTKKNGFGCGQRSDAKLHEVQVMKHIQPIRVLMAGAVTRQGPMETFIERQITTLRSNGIEVDHLPLSPGLRRLPGNMRRFVWESLPLAFQDGNIRRQFEDTDLIHFQWPAHLMEWYPLAQRFKKPIILSLRGRQIHIVPHMPGQQGFARALRQLLPKCDAYHCVSEDIMHAGEGYGLVRERARIIRPAVDTNFFKPKEKTVSAGRLGIAMVGGLVWRKGIEYAVIALGHLLRAGVEVKLTVVGDGVEEDRIRYAAKDLGVEEHIELVGRKSPAEILAILQASDMFLHASLSEGIANVVLEAMACGLPVVSTDAGGMREAIDEGVEGYLVGLRNSALMADRLKTLAMSKERRMTMGQRARERAVRQFDLQDQGRQFVSLYQELLSKR